ncbi:hypothetical protein [Funiculus sociatus]|uniref:hypothetical protein n=1 Tax=Funiculus sociatus TaxID=450527 RepID=UPI003297773A
MNITTVDLYSGPTADASRFAASAVGKKNQRQQVDGTSDVPLDISMFLSRTFTNCQRREANL